MSTDVQRHEGDCSSHLGGGCDCRVRETVTDELPRIPGSVISAVVSYSGKTARRILMLRPYEPCPWVSEQDVCDRMLWDDEDLMDVRVIWNREGHYDE